MAVEANFRVHVLMEDHSGLYKIPISLYFCFVLAVGQISEHNKSHTSIHPDKDVQLYNGLYVLSVLCFKTCHLV